MKGKKLKYRLVSYAVVEQYKWERDIAISQLEELGIGFGENPKLKAIPIEWIEDWLLTKMKWKEHITIGKLFTGEDAIRFYVQDMFYAMLMDWRDENVGS